MVAFPTNPVTGQITSDNMWQWNGFGWVRYTTTALVLLAYSINAALNTVSNLDTTMFAANIVDTDSTMAANSDLRLATQRATSSALALKAALLSPTFTGTPVAPTAANGTNTTQLATTAYVRATRIDQFAAPAASVTWNSQKIINLLDPASSQDAATKNYVDTSIQASPQKPAARLATTGVLPTNTYFNGVSGVGAALTANSNGVLTVDGVAVVLNDVILVKNEATDSHNGLYVCSVAGTSGVPYVLTRSTSMDVSTEYVGAFIPIGPSGTANANSVWMNSNTSAPTVGTTAITFAQNVGTLTAGAGITISGATVSVTAGGITNAMLAGSIDLTTKVTGALPAANFPALTGNVTTTAGSLATTIAAGAVTNAMLAGSIDLTTKVTGVLPEVNFPALTGNVTTTAGSLATTIAAGAVTNAMLAGSIDLTTKVTGVLPEVNLPALIISNSAAPTVGTLTGLGTSPSASVAGGANGGVVTLTTGSGSPGATGTFVITWSPAFPAAPNVVVSPLDGTGTWAAGVTLKVTAQTTSTATIAWANAGGNLATTSTFKVIFNCIGN